MANPVEIPVLEMLEAYRKLEDALAAVFGFDPCAYAGFGDCTDMWWVSDGRKVWSSDQQLTEEVITAGRHLYSHVIKETRRCGSYVAFQFETDTDSEIVDLVHVFTTDLQIHDEGLLEIAQETW